MTKLSSPSAQVIPWRSIVPLFVIPLLLLALIYFVVFPNDIKLQSVFSPCNATPPPPAAAELAGAAYTAKKPDDVVDFRMFLGVLTRPDFYERRNHIRLAYALQPRPSRAVIDVRFVFCSLDREEDAVLVALEVIAHGDILVLNCTENMNDGKTYEYFSTVGRLFSGAGDDGGGERYDYVGKTDDDTYYRLASLADTLRGKPRRDMYHGFLTPCHTPPATQYMSGMGYIVSWDIVEWVAATAELRGDHDGPEDMVFGRWLRSGGKGKNVFGEEPRMYDYLADGDELWCFRHAFTADTVAVHKLKNRLKWARTLKFFNATQGLKPSKMYRIDI